SRHCTCSLELLLTGLPPRGGYGKGVEVRGTRIWYLLSYAVIMRINTRRCDQCEIAEVIRDRLAADRRGVGCIRGTLANMLSVVLVDYLANLPGPDPQVLALLILSKKTHWNLVDIKNIQVHGSTNIHILLPVAPELLTCRVKGRN